MTYVQAGPLRWRAGAGWLVLVGGGHWRSTEAIDFNAIELMIDDAPIAFVPTAPGLSDDGDSFLEHYRDLGAPPGYIAPIYDRDSANDAGNAQQLARAGLIYIGGGDTRRLLDAFRDSRALKALAAAYENGAVVVGCSAGAIALAAWGAPADEGLGVLRGWGWLPDVIVAPHYDDAKRAAALRDALIEQPNLIGLGLPDATALVFGPDGEIVTWGSGQPHVTFGSGLLRSMRT